MTDNTTSKPGPPPLDWFLRHGGPSVRYQAHTLFSGSAPAKVRDELENSEDIRRLLTVAQGTAEKLTLRSAHGAPDEAMENVLPMLLDRGMDSSFTSFDKVFRPMLPLVNRPQPGESPSFQSFLKIIILPFLLRAGYREAWMVGFFRERLALVGGFARGMDFGIYDDQSKYRGVPKTFRDRRVIKPELYVNGAYQFPLIYDLHGYRAMADEATADERARIADVLRYVIADEYQRFPTGYGILYSGPSRYHAMGWDAVLPPIGTALTAPVLHRAELLAPFPEAVATLWFQEALSRLMDCKQSDGTFLLPKEALRENHYCWVLAGHMSLGENRRRKDALLALGTLRAWRLLLRISQGVKP